MKILIVEDDLASSEMLRLSLEKEGYECLLAENGNQALLIHSEHKPDLIISDVRMPEMDGIELLEKLRSIEEETIIIIVTGHSNEELALRSLELGANNYIKKPINLTELKLIIRRYSNILESKYLSKQLPELIEDRTLKLELPTNTQIISSVIDYFQDKIAYFYTAKQLFQIELGLTELITNAIEHGNLGITKEDKTLALKENSLESLYRERLQDPVLSQKTATIVFKQTKEYCSWQITDQGSGFNWKNLPNPTHLGNIGELHGRGVFLSRLQFDKLEYIGSGNCVIATKYFKYD